MKKESDEMSEISHAHLKASISDFHSEYTGSIPVRDTKRE